MDQIPGLDTKTEGSSSIIWMIVKIALVILVVFLGIKFFSERKSPVDSDNDIKKPKPKTQK